MITQQEIQQQFNDWVKDTYPKPSKETEEENINWTKKELYDLRIRAVNAAGEKMAELMQLQSATHIQGSKEENHKREFSDMTYSERAHVADILHMRSISDENLRNLVDYRAIDYLRSIGINIPNQYK